MERELWPTPLFDYPRTVQQRRHGPRGYADFGSYKPWLRDEYACCHCNSAKRDVTDIPDPCEQPYAAHLEVLADGAIRGLSLVGLDLIKICQLDRPKLTEYRRRMISLSRALASRQIDEAVELRLKYFGYPDNLPRLSTLRPPNGNSRLAGIADSHYERRKRGELPKLDRRKTDLKTESNVFLDLATTPSREKLVVRPDEQTGRQLFIASRRQAE